MTEPMGDARVLLMLRDECREHQSAGLDAMTMSIPAVLALFNQRDAERSRADAAEAARDAALARADSLIGGLARMQAHRDAWRSFARGKRDEPPADYLPDLPIPTPGDAP